MGKLSYQRSSGGPVLLLPAFPVKSFCLQTFSPTESDGHARFATCVNKPSGVPDKPCEAFTAGPAIVPIAFVPSSAITPTAFVPSPQRQHLPPSPCIPYTWQRPIQVRHHWQTIEVANQDTGNNVQAFRFEVESKLVKDSSLLHYKVDPCTPIFAVPYTLYRSSYQLQFCVSMQQVENPYEMMRRWLPPRAIRWQLKAYHRGTAQPAILDLVLGFALPNWLV